MVRPSGRQILDFPIGEFGRNAERDGGKSRGGGGCEIDGNLGPPISSSAIIKSFERVGAGWERQQDTQAEMRHEVG